MLPKLYVSSKYLIFRIMSEYLVIDYTIVIPRIFNFAYMRAFKLKSMHGFSKFLRIFRILFKNKRFRFVV